VDGVYSADPRVVPDAEHLPHVDLAVLAEMAEAGAKVVNAQAVEWARRSKIAIVARRTSDPVDGSGLETVARGEDDGRNVRAIVAASNVMLLKVSSASLAAFLRMSAELELTLGDVIATADEARVHVPLQNVPDWGRCERQLVAAAGSGIAVEGTHAVVSVVGHGLTGTSGALGRTLERLAELGATPRALSAGPLRISATVPDDAELVSAAQRSLHAAFVG